jgi:hypothetical protein
MRRILVFTLLVLPPLFVASRNTYAQGGYGQAGQRLESVARQLNLTQQQELRLMPILKTEAPKVQAIKNDTSLSRIQKIEQIKAIHDQTEPQVKAILTPAQYQNLQEMRRQEVRQLIGKKLNQ